MRQDIDIGISYSTSVYRYTITTLISILHHSIPSYNIYPIHSFIHSYISILFITEARHPPTTRLFATASTAVETTKCYSLSKPRRQSIFIPSIPSSIMPMLKPIPIPSPHQHRLFPLPSYPPPPPITRTHVYSLLLKFVYSL